MRFDGTASKKPPQDPSGAITIRQGTTWIDSAKVTIRNNDGFVLVSVELTNAVIGYAVEVNGRSLPDSRAGGPA